MDFLLEPQTRTKTGRKKAKHTFVVHAEANAMLLAGQADLDRFFLILQTVPAAVCPYLRSPFSQLRVGSHYATLGL